MKPKCTVWMLGIVHTLYNCSVVSSSLIDRRPEFGDSRLFNGRDQLDGGKCFHRLQCILSVHYGKMFFQM